MELNSRIIKFIPKGLMYKLNGICRDRTISDNNKKADLFAEALREYKVPFRELGPGTNRYAVRIDGYVFKIAMDKNGINDNYIEFSMSAELQPYVSKTYECNGLIIVSEYVTVITKEEFKLSEEPIKDILSILSSEYLLGDVGFVLKNYLNWGYREDGSLVILDYGFIYRVTGEEVRCDHVFKNETVCGTFLEYDENYHNLVCPKCKSKYNFADIRRKMDLDYEKKEIEKSKSECYIMTTEKCTVDDKTLKVVHSVFSEDNTEENNDYGKEEDIMDKNKFDMTPEESYEIFDNDVINCLSIMNNRKKAKPINDCNTKIETEEIYSDTLNEEVDKEDETLSGIGSNFYDNSDGLYYEADELVYTMANLFGEMVLYTPERIQDTDVPDGMYKYELRETDDYEGYVCEVGHKILIHFWGTVLCTKPIKDLDTCPSIFVDYTTDFTLTQRDLTLTEFKNQAESLEYIESKCKDENEAQEELTRPLYDGSEDIIIQEDEEDDDDEFVPSPEDLEILANIAEENEDEDYQTMPTPEDTVIPIDDYTSEPDDEDENIEYANDEEEDCDNSDDDDEFEDDSDDEESEDDDSDDEEDDEEDEDEESEDDDSDDEEDDEEDEDEDSDEDSDDDIDLIEVYNEMLANEFYKEEDDEEEEEEKQTTSFTSWSEPTSRCDNSETAREQLRSLVDEEEEEERRQRSAKNYKNKRRNN